jgi:hypothetical protein
MITKSHLSACIRTLAFVLGFTFMSISASAATYLVTSPFDSDPSAPSPGTLRYAIQEAEVNPGPDTIYFDVIGPCPCDVAVLNNIRITSEITIDGLGQIRIYDAGGDAMTFDVYVPAVLTLRRISLFGGAGAGSAVVNASGSVTIENSAISNYFSSGLRNGNGQMAILGTTITENDAFNSLVGGGIWNSGTLTIVNSTISGNQSQRLGGGIYNNGSLTVRNSTIANNRCNVDTFDYTGGGIYSSTNGIETLHNTIVIGNVAESVGNLDVPDDVSGGPIESYSNVVVGNPGTAGQMVDGANGSIIGSVNGTQLLPASEVIGALAENGGPTKTHALVAGSPAIDAGSTVLAVGPDGTTPLSTDQRGSGFPRVVGSSVDIGAWEGEPNVAPEILNFAASGPISEGGTVTITGTISDGNAGDTFGGQIDWGDGHTEVLGNLSVGDFQLTHTYADNDADGVYTVELNINDIGFFASETTTVTVNNLAPVLSNVATNPASPIIVGSSFDLTGQVSDPGGDLISDIEINWGDGQTQHPAANPALTAFGFPHTYTTAGNYAITVTFTDDEGAESSAIVNVTVTLPPPPAAPTLLRVDSISMDRMTIQWSDNSNNEDGFAIESCRNKGCSVYREIGRVGANVNTFTDVNLIANTQYYYRVRAFNLGGFSQYSNKATGKTLRK